MKTLILAIFFLSMTAFAGENQTEIYRGLGCNKTLESVIKQSLGNENKSEIQKHLYLGESIDMRSILLTDVRDLTQGSIDIFRKSTYSANTVDRVGDASGQLSIEALTTGFLFCDREELVQILSVRRISQ